MNESDQFFPDSERVIYATSPLKEVVCEIRFPPILRIDNPAPADFQEEIRRVFPFFEKQAPLPPGMNIPEEIANVISAQHRPVYQFFTEDRDRMVSMTNSTIALTSYRYERWEKFAVDLNGVLEAFVRIYEPAFFTRIGLRYQNLLDATIMGEVKEWHKLLSENVAGELGNPLPGPVQIFEARRVTRFMNPSTGEGVLLQHGIGTVEEQTQPAYIVDIDCYTDAKTGARDATSILSRLNSRARRAFRWCITDKLHDSLGPRQVDDDVTS